MKSRVYCCLNSSNSPFKPLVFGVLMIAAITMTQSVYADSARLIGDTYVVATGGESSKGHGNKPVLLVKQGGMDSYVKFVLANAGSSVARATLKVFVSKVTAPGTLALRQELPTWDEATLSSTNLPGPGEALKASASVTTAEGQRQRDNRQ